MGRIEMRKILLDGKKKTDEIKSGKEILEIEEAGISAPVN